MINNFFTLRHIAESLDTSLKYATIDSAFSQERDVLVIALQGRTEHLVVSCRSDFPTCFLHQRMARARRNTADVMPTLCGCVFQSVAVSPGDRVLTATFTSGLRLVLQFFGSKTNAFVADADGIVLEAFRDAKKHISSLLPVPTLRNAPAIPETIIPLLRRDPGLELSIALKKALPYLGSTLAREIVWRAGITTPVVAGNLDNRQEEALQSAIMSVFSDLESPSPVLYLDPDGSPHALSIIPLSHLEQKEKRLFTGIHDALQTYHALRQSTGNAKELVARITGVLESAQNRAARTLDAMQRDEEEHDRAMLYQTYGTLLMAHLTDVAPGTTECELSNGDRPVSIPLDPMLTPVQNAQRYFERAKHARLARRQAGERKIVLRDRIAASRSLLHALRAATTREDFDNFMKTHSDELDEFGIGRKGPEPRDFPFRVFVVEGGFEVWVGKDNTSNDLLTLRYAKPNDLWFHVRGTPGSHVVLRVSTGSGVPGKKSRQQAAGIAAYYSKMRNARMVPVTVTERKYVRKPKGAAPGSVIVSHEETVFAEPQIPDQPLRHPSSDLS